jgi:tetratricopeptide (TPR) repeat protein
MFLVSVVALIFLTMKFMAAVSSRQGILLLGGTGENNFEEAKAKIERATELHRRDIYYRNLADLGVEEMRAIEAQSYGASGTRVDTEKLQRVFEETIENAKTGKELGPENYKNPLFLGDLYRFFGKLGIEGAEEQARQYYQDTKTLAPLLPSVDLHLARLESSAGNTEAALDTLDEAIQKKTNYTRALIFKARIQLSEEDLALAGETLSKASQTIGNDPELWYEVGRLFYRAEGYENAARSLKNALTLVPNYADAKYYLGLSYRELGRTEDAVSLFKELQQTNQGNREVQSILRELRR